MNWIGEKVGAEDVLDGRAILVRRALDASTRAGAAFDYGGWKVLLTRLEEGVAPAGGGVL